MQVRAGVRVIAAFVAGCAGAPGPGAEKDDPAADDTAVDTDPPDDTGEPGGPTLTVAPDATVANALLVRVEGAGSAAPATADVIGPDGVVVPRPLVPVSAVDGAWEGRLVGLYADTDYTVQVDVLRASGTTDPLPTDLPPIGATVRDLDRMTGGLTVFPMALWAPVADPTWGYLVAVDALGEVVWWYRTGSLNIGLHVEADADGYPVVYTSDFVGAAVAITPATGEVRTLAAADAGLDTVHHEVRPSAGGGLAFLSTEVRAVTGWEDQTLNIVGDVLVEADWDGTVTWSTPLLDHVDPTAVYTADLHMDFWEVPPYYGVVDTPKDWSHGNAMEPDPDADAWIASFRNLDWLVSFDRTTGAPNWAFGPGGDFTLAEGARWSSRQHAPERTDAGTWLVYDNGNARADAGSGEQPYSRVVEYRLDTEAMVAEQVWSWPGDAPYFCPIVGDVDRLAPDRHLITDGAILDGLVEISGAQIPHFSARVREVVGLDDPEIVFEVVIGSPGDLEADGVTVYRAERIPALTPTP